MADLGNRKGQNWMTVLGGQDRTKSDKKYFPIKSVNDLKLCNEEIKIINDESPDNDCISNYSNSFALLNQGISNNIAERDEFSCYIINPNKFSFRKVVRVLQTMLDRMHKEYLKPLFLDYNVCLGWMFMICGSIFHVFFLKLKKIIDCNV